VEVLLPALTLLCLILTTQGHGNHLPSDRKLKGTSGITMSNDQGWAQEHTVLNYDVTPHVVLPDPLKILLQNLVMVMQASLSTPPVSMAIQTFFNTLFFVTRAILSYREMNPQSLFRG
jgi:hypothetical protein